ncbi:DUF4974 domain-containing protein [Fulvivirga maritima]|nr:FecR domain-containing protein [Fulvivirga maritima]UII26751.1 DUF4974 domain-containing protein [Fulvivirga maritima]
MWINAGSSLSYQVPFFDRNIQLKGEAFFEVTRNEKSPFTITSADLKVRVLGTSFNVRNYSEGLPQVNVSKGKVQVEVNQNPDQKAILIKSEMAIVKKNHLVKTQGKFKDIAIWREGKLVFENKPINDIIPELQRWYKVKIELTDSKIGQQRFSGSFHKETLESILKVMHHALCIDYTIQEETVILSKNSCF